MLVLLINHILFIRVSIFNSYGVTVPFTFPAHAVPCIPLKRKFPALDGSALLIGSMAPDLCYIFGISKHYSHSFLFSFAITIPLGLLFLLWMKHCLTPTLKAYLSHIMFVDLHKMMQYGTPTKSMTLLSLVMGIFTHLLWDSFTHHEWWLSSILYRQLPKQTSLFLWITSSIVGSLFVWRVAAKQWSGKLLLLGDASNKRSIITAVTFCSFVLVWFSLFEKKVGGGSLSRSISIPLILFPLFERVETRIAPFPIRNRN